MTGLFAHLFSGRVMPLPARSGAVAEPEHALGDCFPHLIVDPFHIAGSARPGGPASAGKSRALTRLRVVLRRTRERAARGRIIRARATRWPKDDVQ